MVHIIASTVGSSMGLYRQLQTTTKKIKKLCLVHQLIDFITPIPQATLDRDNAEPFTSPTTQQGLQTSLLSILQPPADVLHPGQDMELFRSYFLE